MYKQNRTTSLHHILRLTTSQEWQKGCPRGAVCLVQIILYQASYGVLRKLSVCMLKNHNGTQFQLHIQPTQWYSSSPHPTKKETATVCTKSKYVIAMVAWPNHLRPADVGFRRAPAEQPPPDSAYDLGCNKMLLRRRRLTGPNLILPLAWQHVLCPARTNADVLDLPLAHRQQQGDKPEKHQLCIAPRSN